VAKCLHASYLVRTSKLHLLIMHESSKKIGNHPRTQTLSPAVPDEVRSSPIVSSKS